MCKCIFILGIHFSTVHNLWVIRKKIKVTQEGPIYTHNIFCTSGVMCACMQAQCAQICMHVSIFGNSFETVQNVGVMKKVKVAQEGSMYTDINVCNS